LKARS